MKKIMLLLIVPILLASCFTSSNTMTFQVGDESGRLFYKGSELFQASAQTFWKMNNYPCSLFCENENIIFAENTVVVSLDKKPRYGAALFTRNREENCWDRALFIPRDSLVKLGKVVKIFCPDSCVKNRAVMVRFQNGTEQQYQLTFQ